MVSPDQVYAVLAGVALGGLSASLLFPTAATVQTVSLLASISAAGALIYGEQSGAFQRQRERHRILRDSQREIWIQQQASREALSVKRIEVEELVETLVMLDDLTPVEQRHFLKEMGLVELMSLYQSPQLEAQPPTIDVPAVAATPEPEPEFAGSLEWAVQNVIAQSHQPTPVTDGDDTAFPEVDLGKACAEMMVQGDVPLCVLLACPARTGKTTLMTTTIAWLHRLSEGHVKLKIYNGKENIDHATGQLKDRFLGLVEDQSRYKPVETPQAGKAFAEEFHSAAQSMLQPRQYPEVLFLDEFNNIRARVKDYDRLNGLTRQNAQLTQLDTDTGLFVTQGTSRKKFLFMTSHSAYVMHIGIDRSYQDSVYGIVLGRGAALDGIYKALNGPTAIVRNGVRAKQLLQQLQEWENSPTRDHGKVVALTNLIDGTYNLYFAKYVDLSKVHFAPSPATPPSPPPEDPYAVWDESFEDTVGHQPEDDPDWQPSSIPPQSPLALLIHNLKQWIKSLPSPPDDEALKAKLLELTGQRFSNDALTGLKRELGL
ncbi:MAG: hypothetical protein IGS50_12455 [Synechococcales cyanobacterium C42_A2020_086]|jgi:hypothetical protein|nr:hypothetical protein [Synechococcales cyanobacterium C42_A2020_086]